MRFGRIQKFLHQLKRRFLSASVGHGKFMTRVVQSHRVGRHRHWQLIRRQAYGIKTPVRFQTGDIVHVITQATLQNVFGKGLRSAQSVFIREIGAGKERRELLPRRLRNRKSSGTLFFERNPR